MSDRIYGLDVWYAYGAIDWERARDEAGIRFAIVRNDKAFRGYRDGARAAGIPVGCYHVFRHTHTPDSAIKALQVATDATGSRVGELPLALDVELPADPRKVGAELVTRLEETVQSVEERYGRSPIIYTGSWFWTLLPKTARMSPIFRRCHLWMAHYRSRGPYMPKNTQWAGELAPWGRASIWQFSGNHSAPVAGTSTWRTKGCKHKDCQAIDRNVIESEAVLEELLWQKGLRPAMSLPPRPAWWAHSAAMVRGAIERRGRGD